jgi:NAD-dependent deacetylase
MWERFDPAEYATIGAFLRDPAKVWEMLVEMIEVLERASPNPAHFGLAELEGKGILRSVITQNVDGLHQRAGLPAGAVIELHGNAGRARCLDCAAAYSRDEVHAWLEAGAEVADCPACGGIVKPWTVLFGEAMPAAEIRQAERRARAADLFVVVGSSLAVYPAAYLPVHARAAGAVLVIVNLAPTARDHHADLVIRGRAGEILTAVVAGLEGRPG